MGETSLEESGRPRMKALGPHHIEPLSPTVLMGKGDARPRPAAAAGSHSSIPEEDARLHAFDTVLQAHQDRIFRYCVKILGRTIGEEVAQDVFLSAWESFATFRHESELDHWLLGIARNKCKKALRNHGRRGELFQSLVHEMRTAVYWDAPDQLSEKIETQRRIDQLTAGLKALKEKERLVVNLRYAKGLSSAEIANVMGKSEAAIRQQLTRAVRRLREVLTYGSR